MTKLSPKMWYLLKYGFLALVTTGMAITILQLSKPSDNLIDEHFREPYAESFETHHVIRQDAEKCLINLLMDEVEANSSISNSSSNSNVLKTATENKGASFLSLLSSFNNVLSAAGVKGAIIEPSILHCMIHFYYQDILMERNFVVTKMLGQKNVITYAILGHDVANLRQEENLVKFRDAGFTPHFVTAPAPDWMPRNSTSVKSEASSFVSHILYKHIFFTVHIVVFYERRNYFWHAGLDTEAKREISSSDQLLFVNHDSAYEKFTFFPLESKTVSLPGYYVPSTSHYFLLETLSSRFLECNVSRNVNADPYLKHPKSHSGMSAEHFNRRMLVALHQLKSIFHPMLINFWIWSGTMLGWYRECDIIPYTSDVDFAAWASDVDNLDLIINFLLNNKHLQIKERMGILDEALEFNIACHGLRADVFFLYKIENGSWCSGHSPRQGYYFRYYYPPFTLCSAELLGQKVLVPCETEDVILTEYGPGWKKPVSTWHYESSIRNRGPNIYWDKQKLKRAYSVFY